MLLEFIQIIWDSFWNMKQDECDLQTTNYSSNISSKINTNISSLVCVCVNSLSIEREKMYMIYSKRNKKTRFKFILFLWVDKIKFTQSIECGATYMSIFWLNCVYIFLAQSRWNERERDSEKKSETEAKNRITN